jgi:hypothetical protein
MGMAGASSESAQVLHSPTAAAARMNSCMAQHGLGDFQIPQLITIVSEASARGSEATSGCTETDAWSARGVGVVLSRGRERETCLGDHQHPQK